ncbi:hypothetical protein ACI1US_01010 [Leucobacter sp. BZR 635]
MTAADVRTAAQAEAERLHSLHTKSPCQDLETAAFVAGAVWGAALVTPTREQIAETLRRHNHDELLLGNIEWDGYTAACACGWRSYEFKMPGDAQGDHFAHSADAVLALSAGLKAPAT